MNCIQGFPVIFCEEWGGGGGENKLYKLGRTGQDFIHANVYGGRTVTCICCA